MSNRLVLPILVATSFWITTTVGTRAQAGGSFQADLPQRSATYSKTPDGDYLITYYIGNAVHTATVVPNTKIEPSIVSSVTFDDTTGDYTYSYKFANGRTAKQKLAVVDMYVPVVESHKTDVPMEWRTMAIPGTNRLMWMREFHPDVVEGLLPGAEVEGFRIFTKVYLPAPVDVACRGNITGVTTSGIPDEVLGQLQNTPVFRPYVPVPAIVPFVSTAGVAEGAVTAQEFGLRFLAAYTIAFEYSKHPARAEVLAALREGLQKADTDRPGAGRALSRARELALAAGQDAWAVSLGQALALCIDFMKTRFGL